MLTLTVKEGGYVKIGDDIYVKYVSNVKSNSISLGIEAPKNLVITRDELYKKDLEKKAEENSAFIPELEKAKARKGKYVKERKPKENIKRV